MIRTQHILGAALLLAAAPAFADDPAPDPNAGATPPAPAGSATATTAAASLSARPNAPPMCKPSCVNEVDPAGVVTFSVITSMSP
jgi:hypothetical protein